MNLVDRIRDSFVEPRLNGIDYNSDALIEVHREILSEKKMLQDVFSEFYCKCIDLDAKYFVGSGKKVEIGAGVSFFKKKFPEIISSDIKKADNLDMVIDAMDMNFPSESIHAIYGLNCFHHFPDPNQFFKELNRVLEKGGGCILIEPYYGFIASQFYKKLFDTETFDKTQKEWTNANRNYMVGANQALSYIVFKRDIQKFNKLYPELEIVYEKPLNNYLRYLLSGGLNYRSLLPYQYSPILKGLELFLLPFNRLLALHYILVIKKKKIY